MPTPDYVITHHGDKVEIYDPFLGRMLRAMEEAKDMERTQMLRAIHVCCDMAKIPSGSWATRLQGLLKTLMLEDGG